MTLDEAREVLVDIAWACETPLVALFDELVEQHDAPLTDREGNKRPGVITQVFADYERGYLASVRVVALLTNLRRRYKMPLYTVGA